MKRRLPLTTLSLVAGFAVLGDALGRYRPELRTLCGGIAMVVGIAFIIQSFVDPTHFSGEMQERVGFSAFAYFSLALLYLAPYAEDYFVGYSAKKLFWVALIAHGILTLFTLFRFLREHGKNALQPTSLLYFVGIAAIGDTAAAFGLISFGRIFFTVGLVAALGLYTLLLRQHLTERNKERRTEARNIPGSVADKTIAVEKNKYLSKQLDITLLAPVGILLAAYSLLFSNATPLFFLLFGATIVLWGVSVWRIFFLFVKPFSADLLLSAFPFAISALALQRTNSLLSSISVVRLLMPWISLVAVLLATILCYLLLLRLLWHLVGGK